MILLIYFIVSDPPFEAAVTKRAEPHSEPSGNFSFIS